MEYVGETNRDGRPHGLGTYTHPDGATYTGALRTVNSMAKAP